MLNNKIFNIALYVRVSANILERASHGLYNGGQFP